MFVGLFLVPLPTVMHRRAVATLRQRLLVVTAAAGRRPGVVAPQLLHDQTVETTQRCQTNARRRR